MKRNDFYYTRVSAVLFTGYLDSTTSQNLPFQIYNPTKLTGDDLQDGFITLSYLLEALILRSGAIWPVRKTLNRGIRGLAAKVFTEVIC